MKTRAQNKTRKLTKGMPSAVLLSIAIHTALFLLAGWLVVFTVVKQKEIEFEPPKAMERPKMKLKKPKVRIKKSAKPRPTTRIVTKVQKASMPDIQLPEMSGMETGLDGGLGGFDMMPDLDTINIMGNSQTDGSDLVGTFYDFNRRRDGRVNGIDQFGFDAVLQKFNNSGWKEYILAKYYRSPKKLYATTIAVPPMPSPLGPAAFGEPDNDDKCWMVLYKGELVCPASYTNGIRFRFVGNSDDKLAVRVDGEVVLDACREDGSHVGPQIDTSWLPDSADSRKWYYCHDYSAVSHLIELEPGVPKDLEIIIGEGPGTLFNAILFVKVEGVEYEKGLAAAPILPVFKTAPLPRRLQDMIYRGMPEGEMCVTNGPVFNDYYSSAVAKPAVETPKQIEASGNPEAVPGNGMRTWTSKDGKSFDAEFVVRMGKDIVLKTARGRQKKIPIDRFSERDLEYVALAMPPALDLDLAKRSNQRRFKFDKNGLVGMLEYTFSPKIKCSNAKYNHRLKVDYWVIGSEIGGSRFILLDKGSDSFVPAEQPHGSYRFSGNPVELRDWTLEHIYQQRRGERYKGFVITVTDERGIVIAHRESPNWLYKNLDKLKNRELWSFLDNKCNRVWPTPLKHP